MNDYPKWPHLENLDRVLRDIPDYLTRTSVVYTVTEKVHGFNARFGKDENGVCWAGSRNLTVAEGDPADWDRSALQGFIAFAADRVDRLNPGFTIYGEWAGQGVQKGIDYGEKAFWTFGWDGPAGEDGKPHIGALEGWDSQARSLGLRIVPILSTGPSPDLDTLNEMRNGKSLLAEQGREGVVITPFPPILDAYGHVVIAKYKAASFEERAHARREQPAPLVLENVQAFVDEYVTTERLYHVLQQVEEMFAGADYGNDPLDRRFTGDVLRLMYADIIREGRADFEALSETDQKAVGKYSANATKPLLDAVRQAAMEQAA